MLKFGTPTIVLPRPIKKCTVQTGCTVYVGRCMSVVCQINCVGGITWTKHAHAQSQVWAVKTDL